MNSRQHLIQRGIPRVLVAVLAMALAFGDALGHLTLAQATNPATPPPKAAPASGAPATTPPTGESTKIPSEQLEMLVAPVALYPDPLLAQVLAASTYPLELVQLQQWLAKNPGLKDQALVTAVGKEPWIQAFSRWPAYRTW